jgi:T-complex protein 1 subunit alpha
LVELADLQDQEVGDGTTSVVLIAAELLKVVLCLFQKPNRSVKRANELVQQKIHPTSIINGYRLACREAVKYIQDELQTDVTGLGRSSLVNIAKTSMSSKLIGP